MGIDVSISETPSEVPDPIPFPEDRDARDVRPGTGGALSHGAHDGRHRHEGASRAVPRTHHAGALLLGILRPRPHAILRPAGGSGGRRPTSSAHFSSDAEQICAGWWPGDHRLASPAFFSYAYPAPDRHRGRHAAAAGAAGAPTRVSFSICYDDALRHADPRRAHPRVPRERRMTGAANLLGMEQRVDALPRARLRRPPPTVPGDPHERSLPASRSDPRRHAFGNRMCRLPGAGRHDWVHLRVCQECGHVGCCDYSPR